MLYDVYMITLVPFISVSSQLQATQEEIRLHRHLRHKNIVQYYGAFIEDGKLKIFMEYVPGGTFISYVYCVPGGTFTFQCGNLMILCREEHM